MTDSSNPSEIARETLRRLASSRLPPTPDNYRDCYHEIIGTHSGEAFPDKRLRSIAAALPRTSRELTRLATRFEQAVASGSWQQVERRILDLCEAHVGGQLAWGTLIRDLLQLYERDSAGFTRSSKLEAINHVLEGSGNSAPLLFDRLRGLLKSWNGPAWAMAPPDLNELAPTDEPAPGRANGADEQTAVICALVNEGIPPLLGADSPLLPELRKLGALVAQTADPATVSLLPEFHALCRKLEWAGEDQRELREGLISLVQLIIDNINELVLDDHWLSGQLGVLNQAFSGPLDIRVVDEVERRLRDVIDKQGKLKQELNIAQSRLKTLLAGFVDRLAEFSSSTNEYHQSLDHCAKRISEANDINELSEVVEEIIRETRTAQDRASRSHDELDELRDQVSSANSEISRLQKELDQTSELVRHDPLTGTLNRKGLDEAIAREIARARRRGTPLCLALLDIDNFKSINDIHGHKAGDEALIHLAQVVQRSLRPQDSVGRYGGEEFVIVLPDTHLEDGQSTLTRLQRELTKRFFLAGNQKILITFSAGVTRLDAEDDPVVALDRADRAMYAAKRAGKNRVFAA